MSDGFKIQVNVKAGDELINLRADSGPEMASIIEWVTGNAGDIQAVIALLKGANTVAGAFPGAQVVQQTAPQAAPQQQGGWSQQGSQQSQAPVQQQAAPPANNGEITPPVCAHGAMQRRTSKAGAARAWVAYMCPTPQGTPNQCKPIDAVTGKSWK